MTDPRTGLFITFEGMDGCGKTTQMRLLTARLRGAGYDVVENYEPGGTPVGSQIRKVLLDARNQELSPTAELLLYFACRAQNVDQTILPALRKGKIVVSDRFTDSTLAYQAAGRGLDADIVRTLDRIACRGLVPDLTVLLDIDAETSLARARIRNSGARCDDSSALTRIDDESLEFHIRVGEAYAQMAAKEPKRFIVIDGRPDVATVEAAIWQALEPRIRTYYD
jgi:dTMP kinase